MADALFLYSSNGAVSTVFLGTVFLGTVFLGTVLLGTVLLETVFLGIVARRTRTIRSWLILNQICHDFLH
ncbi:MAG: hypothetical protein HC780_18310 [Leptolyngbyaceae cyanobacterium CSU_1_3]|nr:hypothetical protein [Leptolyngbyaceae cyanobacterium CSU_1_3]